MQKITPYFYIAENRETKERFLNYCQTLGQLMYNVSKIHAFDDCEYEDWQLVVVSADGKLLRYAGWQPGMRYQWYDENGEVVWDCCYPEWDH